MYICESCKKKPATVHIADIHDGKKRELHLCQDCAEKQGINFQQNFSLSELLGHLTQGQGKDKAKRKESEPELTCSVCKLTWREFQSRGRLGCANDYKDFRSELLPMIERIHGKTAHVGKTPGATAGKSASGAGVVDKGKQLMALQKELRLAVDKEEYEKAARLRDRISKLKRGQGDDA